MCSGIYTEPETEEHKNGKAALYQWALMQGGLTDVVLEGWMPGTRQRPDLMFKYNGQQYVIEFQCSPICSEYYERHELYAAGGVIDIWVLGTEKYKFNSYGRHGFTMEKTSIAVLNVSSGKLTFFAPYMQKLFYATGKYFTALPNVYSLSDCIFENGQISVSACKVGAKLPRAIKKNERDTAVLEAEKKNENTILITLSEVKEAYGFTIEERRSKRYIAKIEFCSGKYAFFKRNKVDFCERDIQWSFSDKIRFEYTTIKTIDFDRIIERREIISAIEQFKALMTGGV